MSLFFFFFFLVPSFQFIWSLLFDHLCGITDAFIVTARGLRASLGRCIMAVLPPFNFLTLHYVYYLATCLICSAIFWGASTSSRSVAYVDALFMCVSAMTGAGLNTVGLVSPPLFSIPRSTNSPVKVDLSSLNTFQQIILFLLIVFGSPIIISWSVLHVRKKAFESKFRGISEERSRCQHGSTFDSSSRTQVELPSYSQPGGAGPVMEGQRGQPNNNQTTPKEIPPNPPDDYHIQWVDDDQVTVSNVKSRQHHHHRVFPMAGVGARQDLSNLPRDVPPNPPLPLYEEKELSGFKSAFRGTQKYLLASRGLISRNSQFHNLTPAEREELGGVEYRAVSFLSIIVPIYFFSFLILGLVGVGSWLQANHPNIAQENGLSPFWTGAFFAASAFGNSGMALLDANVTALQKKYVALFL